MKNIVFDLGGVVFARKPEKCSQALLDCFAFLRLAQIPKFWNEYDRGTLSYDKVRRALADYNGISLAAAEVCMREAIDMQEEIAPTKKLIFALRERGYRLYVLSNMSREFIDFLRHLEVYSCFEGDVVSCEVGYTKPEPTIYQLLLSRFELRPEDTLFIDDRADNLSAAAEHGISTYLFNRLDPEESCRELFRMLL